MSSIQLTPSIAAIPMAAEVATAEANHAVVNQANTAQFAKEVIEQQARQVNKLEKSEKDSKVSRDEDEEKRRRQGRGQRQAMSRRGAVDAHEAGAPVQQELHGHSESPYEGRLVNRRV